MAAGVGRRFVDGVVTIAGMDGFLPLGPAIGQVLQGYQPALILNELHQGPADVAAVENVPAAGCYGLEGTGQVFLHQCLAGLEGAAIPGKDCPGSGELAQRRLGRNGLGPERG